MSKYNLSYYKIIQSFILWEYCNEIKQWIIKKWMGTAFCCTLASHFFAKRVSCRSAKFTTGDFKCMVRLKEFTLQKLFFFTSVGWKVMATVWYFWHGFIHRGTTFSFHIVATLIYHLLSNVWKASYTISASVVVGVQYWPAYSTYKFISCVVPDPSQWFFHFGEEIVIASAYIGWVWWMFQNLTLSAV